MAESKILPAVATSHMMNAAVNAWHSWKSRDTGGNIQTLGRLMWEHMADAAPESPPTIPADVGRRAMEADGESWVQRIRETAAGLRDNSIRLAKYPGMEQEARARELAALYIEEIATLYEAEAALGESRAAITELQQALGEKKDG